MPLPGGPAAKFGNRYEQWWTVSQLVTILNNQANSIRIEVPGQDSIEFEVYRDGWKEFHQAKRSHPTGIWTIASLKHEGLLSFVLDKLPGNNHRFVFVSRSEARELSELAERAEKAESVEEFIAEFLRAGSAKSTFQKLCKHWNSVDVCVAYELLKRLDVRTADEKTIRDSVLNGLRALFIGNPDPVLDRLWTIVEESIHKTLTRDDILAQLSDRGFALRRLQKSTDALVLVKEITDRYVSAGRKKLIQDSLLPRVETQQLLTMINDHAKTGVDVVLLGRAGSGKSACILEIVESLKACNVPVLAFRLDRLKTVLTTSELGEELGLEESPALVAGGAAESNPVVLIVDQLDAISLTSGRSSEFLSVVEDLLQEVRGVRARRRIHVILACRRFDWENDHRLRRLITEEASIIEISEFSLKEVKSILGQGGFRPELFVPRQLELLQLPQNLALYLDPPPSSSDSSTFSTTKDLFDRYWDAKRRAISQRAIGTPDQWSNIIATLCEQMTHNQELSIPHESLDRFSLDYVSQMISEGVLTRDGGRIAFGHESFFDYCFARNFAGGRARLAEFLIQSEQHLFHRAQVRQVLNYLRDADRGRYRDEVRALLDSSEIRMHIKDLVLTLVAYVPDLDDEDWESLALYLDSQIESIKAGEWNRDQFTSLVLQRIYGAHNWFVLINSRGLVAAWLASENIPLVNMAVQYIRYQQRKFGDEAAKLLEPYVGRSGEWQKQLRYVMEGAHQGSSRRFFDLFLRLIDDGTLDDARDRFAANGSFWIMLHWLSDERGEWIPEAAAHWIRRRFQRLREKQSKGEDADWHELFGRDRYGNEYLHSAAAKAPRELLDFVLPAILEISDFLGDKESELPRRDPIWGNVHEDEFQSLGDAFLTSVREAMDVISRSTPEFLGVTVSDLRRRDTCAANYLLLNAYKGNPRFFADEAVACLREQPWRFHCGTSSSTYWVATQLIATIVPHCSIQDVQELEVKILQCVPQYEKSKRGYKYRGNACFQLLSAVPPEYRSKTAQARWMELQRKFGEPDGAPRKIAVSFVGSPIDEKAAEVMSDEQWLIAISKYGSEYASRSLAHPDKGGSSQLAGLLSQCVIKDPQRFAQLSLRFPPDVNSIYLERVIGALKGAPIGDELKLAVCRKAYAENREEFGGAIAESLGSLDTVLPDDAAEMLCWLAKEHPDPMKELWDEDVNGAKACFGGDILTCGMNTTRGRVAEAVRDVIYANEANLILFHSTIDRLVADTSVSVRSCVASTLMAVAHHEESLALSWFVKLVDTDERLLGTRHVYTFLYASLRRHFEELRGVIERMVRSELPEVNQAGARLVSLAKLYDYEVDELLRAILSSNSESKHLGVAEVASINIKTPECREWCEGHLLRLFDDDSSKVRTEAASCFRALEDESLAEYGDLISAFCDSASFQDDSFSLLYALEKSVFKVPGIAFGVCEKFMSRFAPEARDFSTRRAADAHSLVKVVFRAYHQHRNDEWTSRWLDLIDQMCLESIPDVDRAFQEYER